MHVWYCSFSLGECMYGVPEGVESTIWYVVVRELNNLDGVGEDMGNPECNRSSFIGF